MIEKIKQYLAETRAEVKKVTWPTREELKDSTRVVILATVVITIFIGGVDLILNRVMRLIFQ